MRFIRRLAGADEPGRRRQEPAPLRPAPEGSSPRVPSPGPREKAETPGGTKTELPGESGPGETAAETSATEEPAAAAPAPTPAAAKTPEAAPPAPAPEPPVSPAPAVPRPPDLRLARVHLRTGGLALARADLETLAGQDRLDSEGMLDLAEARWRTGDLVGAAEAAAAYLGNGGDEALAFVISAEAAAAQDRPAEARRFAGRALERTSVSLESIFAGIPRSSIWPHDAWTSASPGHQAGLSTIHTHHVGGHRPAGLGLWDEAAPARGGIDVDAQVAAAERALASGDLARAARHLGVALRMSPLVANGVIEAIGAFSGPDLDLVRGDAFRLLGNEPEAMAAYASAAAALTSDTGRSTGTQVEDDRPSESSGQPEEASASAAATAADAAIDAVRGAADEPGEPNEPNARDPGDNRSEAGPAASPQPPAEEDS